MNRIPLDLKNKVNNEKALINVDYLREGICGLTDFP